jgi:hypothetical protein
MGDNQWSCGVVIARNRSLGALDHQRRDLHSIKLSYLTEDRAASTFKGAKCKFGALLDQCANTKVIEHRI